MLSGTVALSFLIRKLDRILIQQLTSTITLNYYLTEHSPSLSLTL
jgi:hypothetical protein